jgi:hypothetical protein
MVAQNQRLMTIGEFARHVGRSPATIRKWIQRQRISPGSLLDGLVVAERAVGDLSAALDFRRSNLAPKPAIGGDAGGDGGELQSAMTKRRDAEAQSAILKTQRLRNELERLEGAFVDAQQWRAATAKMTQQVLDGYERLVTVTLPSVLASHFGIDHESVAALARQQHDRFCKAEGFKAE